MEITMKFISFLTVILLSFAFTESVQAASVAKVKGRKVLIKVEGSNIKVGKVFYIISENGKKRGLVKIRAVKGNKAIGMISKKSKAQKGWTLRKRVRKVSKRRKRKRKDDEYDPRSAVKSIAVGVLGGFNSASIESPLTGTGFSFKGFVDYKLFQSVWFRGMVGTESLVLAEEGGPALCGTMVDPAVPTSGFDKPCIVEINYATVDLHARYVFGIKAFRPWVGGGINLLFPISSVSTALKEESIETANTFVGAGGVDYHFSPKWLFSAAVEYNFFPASDTVTASFIAGRAGIGYKF